jgi:hypothetical protein
MKSHVLMLLAETGVAALLIWFDMRIFWLYFFAVALWTTSRALAAIAANHFEQRIILETIQNRVGVVPRTDAAALIQQIRDNSSEEEWRQICDTFKFARPA